MNNLINIDIDLINQLRREGKGYEAENLIKEFRNNSIKNKKQLFKEIIRKEYQIQKAKSIRNNICTQWGCNRKVTKGKLCDKCKEYARKRSK